MADFNVTRVSVALIAGLHAALFAPDAPAQAQAPPQRPNIVIILGDDLGFADLGSFGSEIKTPNLDTLAKEGVRFANFYTHASCSPDALHAAERRGYAPERPRQHERVDRAQPARRGRLRGLPQHTASPRCHS